MYKQWNRQTDRDGDRQTEMETARQMQRQKERQTDLYRDIERKRGGTTTRKSDVLSSTEMSALLLITSGRNCQPFFWSCVARISGIFSCWRKW
jgi:hypothetical protein